MNVILICLAILAASQGPASAARLADTCSATEFSCGDGACVSVDLVCDGATHCTNGGDEHGCGRGLINLSSDGSVPRRTRRQTSTLSRLQYGTCTLPAYPAHGTYITNIPSAKPGESYEQVNINITCGHGFVADNSPSVTCFKGNWQNEMPKCVSCGTVTSSARPLISGGQSAQYAEVPWHAGIYRKNTKPYFQICGGSLISTDVVLSAAHCFWNDAESCKLAAASFAVAVGKRYRPWNESMDKEAQKSDVKELHLPSRFQGSEANFQDDIAVLIVSKRFVFKSSIRPVCVDFGVHFEKRQLQVGNKGKVAGWGLTSENGTRSQVLKVIELPYVNIDTCISESPRLFIEKITSDKICAGFRNDGKAVCTGDSGGGLTFPDSDNGTTRYYLRGIVSTAPSTDYVASLCNVNEYTAFTRILKHTDFINNFWIPAGIWSADDGGALQQNKECTLPPYPANGKYVVSNAPNASPGDSLDIAFVNVACDVGYRVNGSSFGYCSNGVWRGQFQCVGLPCKEESYNFYSGSKQYSMEDVAHLHYGTLKTNSTGHRTYFEVHFAIQMDGELSINLSEADNYFPGIQCSLYIGYRGRTKLYYNSPQVRDIATPDILSSTEFRAFYMIIDGDKLQFGKEGDSTPLISYSNSGMGSLKYYTFVIINSESTKIRFCHAVEKGSP